LFASCRLTCLTLRHSNPHTVVADFARSFICFSIQFIDPSQPASSQCFLLVSPKAVLFWAYVEEITNGTQMDHPPYTGSTETAPQRTAMSFNDQTPV
jgi:hypothetical protein